MEIFLFSFSEAYGLEIFTQNSMEIPKWILLLFTIDVYVCCQQDQRKIISSVCLNDSLCWQYSVPDSQRKFLHKLCQHLFPSCRILHLSVHQWYYWDHQVGWSCQSTRNNKSVTTLSILSQGGIKQLPAEGHPNYGRIWNRSLSCRKTLSVIWYYRFKIYQ